MCHWSFSSQVHECIVHLSGCPNTATMLSQPLSGHWVYCCLICSRETSPLKRTTRSSELRSASKYPYHTVRESERWFGELLLLVFLYRGTVSHSLDAVHHSSGQTQSTPDHQPPMDEDVLHQRPISEALLLLPASCCCCSQLLSSSISWSLSPPATLCLPSSSQHS